MSISSDEGKKKVIQIIEKVEGKGGKKAAGKSKSKKPDLSEEEKKAIKDGNAKVAKLAKKCISNLDAVIKQGNKATKFDHAGQDLKDQLDSAKKIEEKYKSKTWEELNIEMTEDGLKELKTSLEDKIKAVNQVEAWVKGGLDEQQLEKLNAMAKKRAEDKKNAKDVN